VEAQDAERPSNAGFGMNDDESLTARQVDQTVVDQMRGSGDTAGFLRRIGLVRVSEQRQP
jgi:hypothetical protein